MNNCPLARRSVRKKRWYFYRNGRARAEPAAKTTSENANFEYLTRIRPPSAHAPSTSRNASDRAATTCSPRLPRKYKVSPPAGWRQLFICRAVSRSGHRRNNFTNTQPSNVIWRHRKSSQRRSASVTLSAVSVVVCCTLNLVILSVINRVQMTEMTRRELQLTYLVGG